MTVRLRLLWFWLAMVTAAALFAFPASTSATWAAWSKAPDHELPTPRHLQNGSDATSSSDVAPFTLVILPDTQNYVFGGYLQFFRSQIEWIVGHRGERNIAFVLHEGDITHVNSPDEWQRARETMGLLNGVVPYAMAAGNHDMGPCAGARDVSLFNSSFPQNLFSPLPTFGAVYEQGHMENSYHVFSAGGLDWLVLVLEFGPRDQVLAWAHQIIAAHAHRRVILLTHAYLYSDDTLHGSIGTHLWNPHGYCVSSLPGGANDGVEIWDKLVRRDRNNALVFNGHVLNDGAGRLVSLGEQGNAVYQMLANYQTRPNGGDGWMRLVEVDPAQQRVTLRTYSPYHDLYMTDSQNQFVFEGVDFLKPTFADVPLGHPNYNDIEALYRNGYTAGCNTNPLMYCPEATMNRAEAAVFIERAIHGPTGVPPQPTTQTFADLPLDSWAAKWAEALWQDHYTAGCATEPLVYCPWQGNTRAEGCVFYLHMLNGPTYQPPQPSQQTFSDVPLEAWYARWVQAAYNAGLITPCQTTPDLRFCPNDPLTRALAASMMVQAKGLE